MIYNIYISKIKRKKLFSYIYIDLERQRDDLYMYNYFQKLKLYFLFYSIDKAARNNLLLVYFRSFIYLLRLK